MPQEKEKTGGKQTAFEFPDRLKPIYRKSRRVEWLTLAYLAVDATLLYLVLGESQAMKAAWLEDIFAAIPPLVFLISTPLSIRPPNSRFPLGYHRAVEIAFFFSAIALIALGLYLFISSLIPFIKADRPTVGGINLFGNTVWLGWLMLTVLLFSSTIPAYFLGKIKLKLAQSLDDVVLHSDGRMNRASWMSAGSAILGVIGIGLGFWWADYVAAVAISIDIFMDGYRNLRNAITTLMDEQPRKLGSQEIEPLVVRVREFISSRDWILDSDVRLRQEGHVYFGDAVIVPRSEVDLIGNLEKLSEELKGLDWRVHDIALIPVRAIARKGNTG